MQLIAPKRHNVAKIQPGVTSHKTTIINVIAVSYSSVARRDTSRQLHSLTNDFNWEYKKKKNHKNTQSFIAMFTVSITRYSYDVSTLYVKTASSLVNAATSECRCRIIHPRYDTEPKWSRLGEIMNLTPRLSWNWEGVFVSLVNARQIYSARSYKSKEGYQMVTTRIMRSAFFWDFKQA